MSVLHELNSLDDAMAYLVAASFGPHLLSDYEPITAESLSEPYRTLLHHNDHMTAVLYRYHGCAVELRVLQQSLLHDIYSRFILLTAEGTDEVLETGVVKINLELLEEAVRDEIVAGGKPLGNILIDHEVMRRIQPKWYMRLPAGCPLVDPFGGGVGEAYGRVGVIYCDHQPAIELLEVVADVRVGT